MASKIIAPCFLALTLLKRHPAHVMLLHTNAINATCLQEIIKEFRTSGWKIISPMEAFKDTLYSSEPNFLPAGESIVWALAKDAGISGLRYPGEDEVYEKPVLDAAGL